MKKIFIATISGGIAGFVIASQFTGPLIAQETAEAKSIYRQLDLFGDIFERIRSAYVEEVSNEELIKNAINGMLTSLDPHSSYLSPKEFDSLQIQTRGEFGGLGIEVTQEDGFIKVVSPIDDTPAATAGIEAGDFISKVDGESTLGLTLNENVTKMRGPVGSEITITILREGIDEPFDVKIIRDIIKIRAVRSYVIDKNIIIRISSFTDQTFLNLKESIQKHIEILKGIDNVDGFVLDLRNNPGGLLNQAVKVSDAFLNAGEIVSTQGRDSKNSERYNAIDGDLSRGKPIIVLINGGSASASEIVAGALQDHQRAIIIGTPSFGKGSVQTIMPLQKEGAIRLTTARYYTPSGRSIQARGVSPDILIEQKPTVKVEFAENDQQNSTQNINRFEADLRGSLESDDISEDERNLLEGERDARAQAAKLRNEDYQLSYALDVLKGLAIISNQQ